MFRKQEYFSAKNIKNNEIKTVIVLHGITKTNRITYLLSKRLSKAGFEVYNITYPSTKYKIQELVDIVNKRFLELGLDKKEKINLVGHSMGGLIIRGYINKYKPKNLDKVVMIATPNHGSELSDFFRNWKFFKWRFGIAGQQLGTDQKDLEGVFGEVNFNLGIIAGIYKHNPLSKIIPGEDDGLVSVESTKLEGMNDHKILNFSHTLALFQKDVAILTIKYLKIGKFK